MIMALLILDADQLLKTTQSVEWSLLPEEVQDIHENKINKRAKTSPLLDVKYLGTIREETRSWILYLGGVCPKTAGHIFKWYRNL